MTPDAKPPPSAGAPVADHHWQPDNRASRALVPDSTTEALPVGELLAWLDGTARWEEKVAALSFAQAEACPRTVAGRYAEERHLGQHHLSLARAACYRDVIEKLTEVGP